MEPTPYPELNTVLRDLVESVQAILADNFAAACLQGSFAVGDYDLHSDVDFVVVIRDELAAAQVAALQTMHGRLFERTEVWAQHLEGSYFPQAILKDGSQCETPLWYLDHGSRALIRSNHCNTRLVRWVVREAGVSLAGPHPKTLVDPIATETLRQEMRDVLVEWGQEILAQPENYNNRWYQTYLVLNFCRILHDLHNGFPGSKRAGAEWAKTVLEPSWTGLIDRAWDGRPHPEISCRQPADPADFQQTLEFIQCIMALRQTMP